MNILPDISLNSGVQKNTNLQNAAVKYFENKDGNIFDDYLCLNENSDTDTQEFCSEINTEAIENLSVKQDEEFYKSGTIAVALIDMFNENFGNTNHSTEICNVIKYVNPDISIEKFDNSPSSIYNSLQKKVEKFISENADVRNFVNEHQFLKDLSDNFLPGVNDSAIEKCLDRVNNEMLRGKAFSAVNISFDRSCTYSELNRLVIQELENQVTPQNFIQFKKNIKEILDTKKDKILFSKGEKVKIGKMMKIIDKIENLEIPVFLSSVSVGEEKTFNFWSLAKNAQSFETKQSNKLSFSAPIALAKSLGKLKI